MTKSKVFLQHILVVSFAHLLMREDLGLAVNDLWGIFYLFFCKTEQIARCVLCFFFISSELSQLVSL